MRRAKCAPHYDILIPRRRLLALLRLPPDPRCNALPAPPTAWCACPWRTAPLGIPRHPDGVRGELERAAWNEGACASNGRVGCGTSWYATGMPVVRLQTHPSMSLKVRAVAALVSSPVLWAMICEVVV